jgi:hypothetical protein
VLTLTPQQQKQQTLDTLVAWLETEAERQPVLVAWEDLHWADPTTLEVLGLLVEQAPTVPMLHVLTYRPAFPPLAPALPHHPPSPHPPGAPAGRGADHSAGGRQIPPGRGGAAHC